MILAVVVSVFLVVSLYRPVKDLVSGKLWEDLQNSLQQEETPSSVPGTSLEEGASDASSSSEADTPAEDSIAQNIRAVSIPADILLSGNVQDYLQSMGLEGINAVMLDLKDSSGRVLYQSHVEMVASAAAQVEGAVELESLVRSLKEAGYQVIGRICAFRDPLASAADDMAAVKYMNSDWYWLDNSQEEGGQSWLNPYSPVAQSYILDIALEAVNAGVDVIALDGVQFPEGYALDKATYGEWSNGVSKDAALSGFVSSLEEEVAARGKKAICLVTATDILAGPLDKYGGVPALSVLGEKLGVSVAPALFGKEYQNGGLVLSAPVKTPYDTVKTVLSQLEDSLSGKETILLFQGYTDTTLDAEDNLEYTVIEIQEQERAATEAGYSSFIVLSQ